MSHVVTIRTQMRDPLAIQTAWSRLKLPAPQARSWLGANDEVTISKPAKELLAERHELDCVVSETAKFRSFLRHIQWMDTVSVSETIAPLRSS